MTKDSTLANFPKTLRELPLWILWRLEKRDGNETKVPYRIDGVRASITNPNDWTDFDTACRAFDPAKYNGLGFVLRKEDNIVCIDLDHCIGDDGKICGEAMDIVKKMNSWTEVSQSGRGLHIFIRGSKPTDKCRFSPREFKSLEVYDSDRYIALTGNHLPGTPLEIMERQGMLESLLALYFPKQESTPPQSFKPHHDLEISDEEIIALCRKAENAEKFVALFDKGDTSRYAGDESRADEALACLLAFYTRDAAQIERLMNASALARREKWREREGYRRLTIQKALDFTQEHYDPNHNAMTRNEAANAKPIDQSMPNLLEKHPLQTLTPQPQAHHAPPVASQPQSQPQRGAFLEGTVSSWLNEAKAQPPITPLFDAFWLKGELAFMFGSAGIGKSILAFQIADAIAKGAKIQNFDGPQTPMKVGYFDFELSARQLLRRYSDENGNVYQFSDNFWRFEISPDLSIPKGMNSQDFLLSEIEKIIIKHRLEVVVIDNLTALLSNITEGKDVLEFMDKLRSLKKRHKISMLVIAHTPKRDLSRPLTKNDMAGSMHLMNFCDSAFCIGESLKESNVRYVKQIKCRDAEFRYDSDNVATFRVVKNGCYLCFEHTGFDSEKEHLRDRTDAELSELEKNIIALHQSEPNLSYSEIARRLNTNKMRVSRVLRKAQSKLNSGTLNTPTPF
jgi:archaellum biogenesis ATPase FlaH